MSRQDANAAFALSSFLQGTNATYIDEIYARYENDPASVDTEWQEFFKSLKDTPADVRKNAEGPSWGRVNWPLTRATQNAPGRGGPGATAGRLDELCAWPSDAGAGRLHRRCLQSGRGVED